jgi:hypothetical protein
MRVLISQLRALTSCLQLVLLFQPFFHCLLCLIIRLDILPKHYHHVSAFLKEINSTLHSVHTFQAPVKDVHAILIFIVTKISTTTKLPSHRVEYSLHGTGLPGETPTFERMTLITKHRKRQNNIILRKIWGFHGVTMKNAAFWNVGSCRSCEFNRRFGGTSVQFTRSTRRHIPEDGILQHNIILQHPVALLDLTLSSTSCRICATSVNINSSYFSLLYINTCFGIIDT